MKMIVGLIGGGVIGCGWAARFLLNGWDVQMCDPDPDTPKKVDRSLINARQSLPSISDYRLPTEGQISFYRNISDAVAGVSWIQESVPEHLDVKQAVIFEIQSTSNQVIGSSTSGFKPSDLQQCADDPSRIVVTHPFNPVYLLPLVELVTNDATSQEIIQHAMSVIDDVRMYALHLTKEIEAHLADRLLEAVWREALWLVKDKVATTQQVDDAIQFGFGLR